MTETLAQEGKELQNLQSEIGITQIQSFNSALKYLSQTMCLKTKKQKGN